MYTIPRLTSNQKYLLHLTVFGVIMYLSYAIYFKQRIHPYVGIALFIVGCGMIAYHTYLRCNLSSEYFSELDKQIHENILKLLPPEFQDCPTAIALQVKFKDGKWMKKNRLKVAQIIENGMLENQVQPQGIHPNDTTGEPGVYIMPTNVRQQLVNELRTWSLDDFMNY